MSPQGPDLHDDEVPQGLHLGYHHRHACRHQSTRTPRSYKTNARYLSRDATLSQLLGNRRSRMHVDVCMMMGQADGYETRKFECCQPYHGNKGEISHSFLRCFSAAMATREVADESLEETLNGRDSGGRGKYCQIDINSCSSCPAELRCV